MSRQDLAALKIFFLAIQSNLLYRIGMSEVLTQDPGLKTLVASELKPPLNPILVHSQSQLYGLSAWLAASTGAVGLDTETNVTKGFFDRRLRTIQIGNREEQWIIDLLALCGYDSDLLISSQAQYGKNLCRPLADLQEVLRPHLESNRLLKVGHNLEFDYMTLKWCLGLRPWHFHDTFQTEKVLYAGKIHLKSTEFNLENTVARELHRIIDKSQQTTFDLTTPLTPAQIEYAALDTRIPLALMAEQMKQVKAAGLEKTVQIENDAVPAFADMHLNGLLIDADKMIGLISGVEAEHKKNVAALDEYFLPIFGSKHTKKRDLVAALELCVAEKDKFMKACPDRLAAMEKDWRDEWDKTKRPERKKAFQAARAEAKSFETKADREIKKRTVELSKFERKAEKFEGEAEINYASDDQLLEGLRKLGFTEKMLRDTNDRSLAKHAKKPVIAALREYRTTHKILTTYGLDFLNKYVNPNTGRVHSRIDQLGAETGRTASSDPNVQNILGGAKWRACFVSRPGYKMLTIDYNGCELRILAELSQEPVWLEAFRNGWDVHSVGAEMIFGPVWAAAAEPGCAYVAKHEKCDCKGHKNLRKRIKAINFGIAYGMEAGKLSEDLGISKAEAEELITTYRGAFVMVTAYLKQSGQFATRNFQSRTMSGRIRYFRKPTWERAEESAKEKAKKYGREFQQHDTERAYFGILSGIEREGKNTPIQGTNADIIKLAMGCGFDPDGKPYAWHLIEPVYNSFLENMIHDELLVESPDEQAEVCYAAVGDAMTRAGAEFVKSIPMTTDGHIGLWWTKD